MLALDDYFHIMMNPFSWQTTTQLSFLSSATCLFLGTSLEDINMLRMLYFSRSNAGVRSVYALMAEEGWTTHSGVKLVDEFAVRGRVELLLDAGVKPVVVKRFADLPAALGTICDALGCRK